MFRKPTKRTAIRQRVEAEEEDGDSAQIVKDAAKRRRRDNPMLQSTKLREKKNDGGSSSSSEDEVNEHAYTASGSDQPLGPSDGGATNVSEQDTSRETDAHAQFERVQQQLKEGLEKDGKTIYKGMAMYGAKEAKDTVKGNAANGLNRLGPMRAPQFLRQTVRWDYAPDICKDYKETGFCTFGDSCKFLHDRGDYKHGWEIERDYLAGNLNTTDETNYEINEDDEDDIPTDCFICGNPFVDPIVTSCKHYFCESCAIQAFKKSKRCKICNENTGGIFNVAKDLIQKLKEKAAKEAEEAAAKSDDDDEEEQEKPIKQEAIEEEHEHGEGCSHHHHHGEAEVKKEEPEEEEEEEMEDEEGEDEEKEEEQEEAEEQEPVEIQMEEIDDQGEVSNSSDIDDEEEEEEAEKKA